VIDTTAAGQITLKEYFDKYKTDFVGNSEYLWTRAMSKFAKLHNRPIAEISLDEVHATIKAFWNAHPVSASRVTQYLAQVFDHARVRKLRLDNPAATKDLYALKGGVAPPRKLPKGAIQPHAALPYDDLPSFVKKLSYENTPSAQCTLFTILTGSRSQEAREARWGWLNDDNTVITIPAEYMKGKKDHLIPLATQLTELLRSLPRTSEYIFPSRSALNRDKVIHANTLTTLVNDMSDNRASLHGFRSTFRDYCADKLDAPKEVYEFCLAHRMGSAAEKAYWRSEVIEKRRVVMQAYADYATGKAPKGNVVKFRAA
jgi:integrase